MHASVINVVTTVPFLINFDRAIDLVVKVQAGEKADSACTHIFRNQRKYNLTHHRCKSKRSCVAETNFHMLNNLNNQSLTQLFGIIYLQIHKISYNLAEQTRNLHLT